MTGQDPDGDGDLPGPYVAVRSVDSGAIARIAAGDTRLALASVSGGVSVLTPEADDGLQFAVEGRPDGLAVGSLVYVAIDGRVFGYDDDGARRWEADVDGVSALCWLPGPAAVVAATDGGEFVVLDGDTGSERRRIDRAHADVSEDVSLAGRDEEFLAGESWYLTGFDADGDRRGEAMLDGTITGIGLLEGVAVASLHGDRIVGVADDGTTRWSLDVGVEWLAPRGEAGLYAATDRGIVRIAPDGDVRDVGVEADDSTQVAITTDGSLACRIDGRTVEVLRPESSISGVDLGISPTSLRVGEGLTVSVERRGGPTTGTVRVDADGASFEPASQSASLEADERASLRFTLEDATDSRVSVHAEFTPEEGGEPERAEATLQVPASAPGPSADAECLAIDDGSATVEVTVQTPDGADLPAVSIDPGDVAVDPEQGRSSVTRTLTVPLGTDRLTVTAGDNESVEAAVSVPSAPLSASVSGRDDGFVDVVLTNDAAVRVDDEVRVTGEPLPAPIERSVSLDAGDRLTLAVPTIQPTGEVRVDAAAVSVAETISLDSAAFSGAGQADRGPDARDDPSHEDPARSRKAEGGSRGGTDERTRAADASASAPDASTPDASASDTSTTSQESSPADAESERAAPTDPASRGEPTDAAAGASASGGATDQPDAAVSESDPAASATDRSTPDAADSSGPDTGGRSAAETADRAAPDAARSDPTPDPSAGGSSRELLDLDRSLASETVHEGYAIEEALTVENRSSEPQSVTIESGGGRATVEIQPEATATASRYHAGWDVESVEVPAAVARTDGAEATVPSASIPVEDAPVIVRPALTGRSGSTDVRLDVRNNLETSCSVLEIGSKGFAGSAEFDGFEIAAGDEATGETTYEGTPTERPALTFVRIDRRRRPLQTLAAVHDAATPAVTVTVVSVDVLDDHDTNVVLEVRNEGGSALDVRLEATGNAPDEYLYSAGEIEGLGPGSVDTHRVECTVDDDRIELPIEVSTTPADSGESQSTTVIASGDRTAEADAWQVDIDDGDDDDPEAPSMLSTPFSISTAE